MQGRAEAGAPKNREGHQDSEAVFVGIDVSAGVLDAVLHPTGESWRSEHTPAAMAALTERLPAAGP